MSDVSNRINDLSPAKRELLAKLLHQQGRGAVAASQAIARRPANARPAPLSFAQERLWFLHQLEPESPLYNAPVAVKFSGRLDVPALESSINEIVLRHENLHTAFAKSDEGAVQVTAPYEPSVLKPIDVGGQSRSDVEKEVERIIQEEARRPFDLERGLLFRAALLRLNEAEHVLLLNMHHIVFDGWSLGVLLRELRALYQARINGEAPPLPALPIQYADFVTWQREHLRGEQLEKHLSYWRRRLEGSFPVLPLPFDRPRPAVQTFSGERRAVLLPSALTEALKKLSLRAGATMFMTLAAAFKTLLYRYTGEPDIYLGTPVANRTRSELEGLIGFFVNTLVLRTNVSGNPTFNDLLQSVRETSLEAFEHQETPFEKIVEMLQPERDLSHSPLFQVMFVMQDTLLEFALPQLTFTALEPPGGVAKFDLTLDVGETPDGLKATLEYNTDLFEAATVERMLGHFQILLEGIVANPAQRIASLPLLSHREQQQQFVEWNETAHSPDGERSAHGLFEEQVARTPDETALICGAERLTYRELNRRANQVAHHLGSIGVGAESRVALCVERSVEMLVGLLGILKAGGAYVPLDPTYPAQRRNYMLADARPAAVLTKEAYLSTLHTGDAPTVCLDRDAEAIAKQPEDNPRDRIESDNAAYVIYTSGSTGQPKGVVVNHGGLCNLSDAQVQCFGVQAGERVLQFASSSFDASIFEIMMGLRAGAALCLPTAEELLPGEGLRRLLREQSIANVTLPPSALAMLPPEPLPALHTVIVAGEACPIELVERWSPGRRFFNAYGPTETTVWATAARCFDDGRKPHIGRPIHNMQVYLLDAHWQPVPVGVPAQLCIAGEGLARGYLGRPEQTAARFIPNPFGGHAGGRLYLTGDLARRLPDGDIDFLGRIDHQVKIRGFRIEPGEIEAVLREHTEVRECAVSVREDEPGQPRLVAYVAARVKEGLIKEGLIKEGLTSGELRSYLKERLPEYMIPNVFVMLDAMPLTPNGKVNRRVLPAPNDLRPDIAADYIAPQNETERQISAVWSEALHLERIGIHDNFFDIGGHSLLMLHVHRKLQGIFKTDMPLVVLFKCPTVGTLARYLNREQTGTHAAEADSRDERAGRQRAAMARRREAAQQRGVRNVL